MPLWAAFPIATVTIMLVYLPTHEAQHDIIARPGTKWRWLNELVGHSPSWMIVSPFAVLRYTHLEHRKHTNDPALDPDHTTHADSAWHAVRKIIRECQPDHIVHHLHPYIPLTRTLAAYWEMRPTLEARGCNIHEL